MSATVVVWILLAASAASHNRGSVTVVGHFESGADCGTVISALKAQPDNALAHSVDYRCVQARIVKGTQP